MSGQADNLEVPVPALGAEGKLRVRRSEYGDYCDFHLYGSGPPLAIGFGNVVSMVSGYAAPLRLCSVIYRVADSDVDDGYTRLNVGNTAFFLPLVSGQLLSEFLGVRLESEYPQEGEG
jgi:hypothetical protein